jgi:hypothetical protein
VKTVAARAGQAWRWTLYQARQQRHRLARTTDRHGRSWLSLAGLTCISAAAYTVACGLDLVVTGLALFVFGWRVSE